jgi:hypothetical protein
MPIFLLEVRATFDFVSALTPAPDNEWKISVKNPLNDFEVKEGVTVRSSELVELENAHVADAHLAVKFEGANKYSTLTVLDAGSSALKPKKKQASRAPGPVTASEEWAPVLAVDCRGLEPCGYEPGVGEFAVTSEAGSVFEEEVDLSDDFCEYCEKGEASVGVEGFEWRWTAL